jgi:hypothetical protein
VCNDREDFGQHVGLFHGFGPLMVLGSHSKRTLSQQGTAQSHEIPSLLGNGASGSERERLR